METQSYPGEHLNRLIAFRQAVYTHGLTRRRDAQMELIDALLLDGPFLSFPQISLSSCFRRRWPSLYDAVEEGGQDREWLTSFLVSQLPEASVLVFSLDTTGWPCPRARTLPDRRTIHGPLPGTNRSGVLIGYLYSLLAYVPEPHTSWALPVSTERVPSHRTAIEVGMEQVLQVSRCLAEQRPDCLPVFVGDGGYGNHRFLRPLRDLPAGGVLVRLRRNRVFYREPAPYAGRGRPRRHGERFAFKEPETWGEPAWALGWVDERWGKVEVMVWHALHPRQAHDLPLTVIRIQAHLERDRPPPPLWLGWLGPHREDGGEFLRWYEHRWPIEPAIRFRKRCLGWVLPRLQEPERRDGWTTLVDLAQWMLFLGREVVKDSPLPWQQPQRRLTPWRVQQGWGRLFVQMGTPASPPQPRGKSPGWPKGRPRGRRTRYPVVRKRPGHRRSAPRKG